MNLADSFLSGFRWVATARLGAQLISWVGTLLVMRLLLPQDYGLAAICSAVVTIAVVIAEFGFGAALVQAEKLEEEQVRSIMGAAILFALVSSIVMVASAPLLSWFFRAPEATVLIQVSALYLLLSPMAMVPDAFLKREMSFRGASIISLVSSICTTLLTLGLAWRGAGVWSLVLGPIGGVFVRASLLTYFFPHPVWPSFRLGPARKLIGFGSQVAMSRVASYVFAQADILVAGRFLGTTALGQYSVAMHLAMLPVTKVMGMVNQVAYPAIAQLNREGQDVRPGLLRGLRLFGYVLVPALWGVAAVAPSLIRVVIGPNWEGAILPLQIVCIVSPLRLIGALMSTAVQGLGRADIALRNTITGAIIMPPCFLAGAFFGATGLALAWLIGTPIVFALNLRRARAVLNVTSINALRAMTPPLACGGLMYVCVRALDYSLGVAADSIAGLAAMVALGVLVYVTTMWLTDKANAIALFRVVHPKLSDAPK